MTFQASLRHPPRMGVLLASEAPVGVVFRRGPTKLVRLVMWNRVTDKFKPGQINLFATGAGQTSPPGVDGKISSPPFAAPILDVQLTIGGVPAQIEYAGAGAERDRQPGAGRMLHSLAVRGSLTTRSCVNSD